VRVVFMGTPEFAVASLRALASSHDVIAVYTRPDAASGRGGSLRPSAVKRAALDLGIDVRQPHTLRDSGQIDALRLLAPDLVCVAAYGLLLPAEVLAVPVHGALNVHASLLPRWRGAAPIQRAILAGDEVTGVSIMRMDEGLDTGDFTEAISVPTDDFSANELSRMLAQLGASALVQAIDRLADGTIAWTSQNESAATYAPKLTKADLQLAPLLTVIDATRRVRASSPQTPARLRIGDAAMTVLRAVPAHPGSDSLGPGQVVATQDGVRLGFADGALELLSIRPEGKRDMPASAWARGARLAPDATWSAPR